MREAGSGVEVEASSWKCLTWDSSSDFLEEPPVGVVGAPWGFMGRGRVLWLCSQLQSCERCPGYCLCCPHTEVSPPGSPLNFGQMWEAQSPAAPDRHLSLCTAWGGAALSFVYLSISEPAPKDDLGRIAGLIVWEKWLLFILFLCLKLGLELEHVDY